MASTSSMVCPLCSNVGHLTLNFKDLIKHLNLFHTHQPDFKVPCGIDGCSRHFTNLRTYQNHMSSVHNCCKNIESRVFEHGSSEDVECFGCGNDNYNDSDDDNDMNTVEILNGTTETAPNCLNHQLCFCLVSKKNINLHKCQYRVLLMVLQASHSRI